MHLPINFRKQLTVAILLCLCLQPVFGALEVIDQDGDRVAIPDKVERIVMLFPQAFGLIFILGLSDNIVGIPRQRMRINEKNEDFYKGFSPELLKAVDVGYPGSPNIETILSLKPDLVISTANSLHSSTANKILRENKIAVIGLKAGFGSYDDWIQAVGIVAKATGNAHKARLYEGYARKKLKMIADRVATIHENKRPKVVMLNTFSGQIFIRGSRTTFGNTMLEQLGAKLLDNGENPGDSSACAEMLFSFDPDIIIDNSAGEETLHTDWWQSLRAVKDNRVYKMPVDHNEVSLSSWGSNTYSPLGVLWLAKKLYPELFSDIDMKVEHRVFCRLIFGDNYKVNYVEP